MEVKRYIHEDAGAFVICEMYVFYKKITFEAVAWYISNVALWRHLET